MAKSNAAKVSAKSNVVPAAPESAVKVKPAKVATKGRKFDGDWRKLPTSRQLFALVIRAIESGESFKLPTTTEEARHMLGYTDA